MSGLRSPDGLVHVISDGPSPSRLFALCDVLECEKQDGSFTLVPVVPERNWGPEDVVDEIPTCLSCIVVVREAIRDG